MGAWGPGTFENDKAFDWLGDLEEADGAEPIQRAISEAASNWEAALAAAEVVAAQHQRPRANLPGEVVSWLDRDALSRVRAAVSNIRHDSEIAGLWPEPSEWFQGVDDLLIRLDAITAAT